MSAKKKIVPVVDDFPDDIPDERFTPPAIVRELHRIYRYDVDAFSNALAPSASIIGRYWTEKENALSKSWRDLRVFAQPPYSRILECMAHGWMEARHNGAILSSWLVPAWTDREWWHTYVEPFRDGRGAKAAPRVDTRFLPGRMVFGNPFDPEAKKPKKGKKKNQAKFWMVLIDIWGRR